MRWLDLPDRDGLWWMWAGGSLAPEPVRVFFEDDSFTMQRLGDEAIIYAGDIFSKGWLPLTPPEPPR